MEQCCLLQRNFTVHLDVNQWVLRSLYHSLAMLLLAGCAAPVDPSIVASPNATSVATGAPTENSTPADQLSRLIPPNKTSDTAVVSNELIIADTVIQANGDQNIQTPQHETQKTGIPTFAAAAPTTPQTTDESIASKLKQLTILAITGDSEAQLKLGDAYAAGLVNESIDGSEIDNSEVGDTEPSDSAKEAHRWYQLAAEQQNAIAQYKLGLQYFHGVGVAQDYAMAREWWLESATLGSVDAQQKLGYLYSEAIGVERNYNRAIYWYTRAANLGHAEAQTLLGSLYHEGNRVPQDYQQAFKWYKRAAERGHPHAQYTLATLYHDGFGTEQSFIKCVAWVEVALASGYADEFNASDECSKYLDDAEAGQAAALAKRWKSSYVNNSFN